MWDVFYIAYSLNKEKEWDILLNHSKFHLEYVKGLVQSLLKGSEADQYIVQNLTWSEVYLMSTLSNDLLQRVMTLVPLTATRPEVYVATMTTIISNSYYSLVDTLNQMKNIKLKERPGRDATDCYNAILVNVESLESSGAFKPDHLGYIIHIFENTSNYRFQIWATQKYKEIMESVKKPLLCDKDIMQTDVIITYGILTQEYLREYSNIVNSKQVDFKIQRSGNGSGSERGSSDRSDKTCHKCGKQGHTKKYCRSKGHGSSVNSPKKSINELPKWVTRKPVDSDNKDLITSTMTYNNNKYQWCITCNNGQVHGDFTGFLSIGSGRKNQFKNKLAQFSDSATNAVIYCSYPMATSENRIKE